MQFSDARTDTDDDSPGAGISSQGKTRQMLLNGRLEGTYSNGRYLPKLTAAFTQYKRHDTNLPDVYSANESLSNNDGERFVVSADNSLRLTDWNLTTFGAEYARDEFTSNGYLSIPDPVFGDYLSISDSAASTSAYAIYGSNHIDFDGRFSATVSGRYDMPDDFGNHFTYSISSGYYLEETDTRLTASYGTAFKVPSLFERYGFTDTTFGPYNGNPNLRPEESRGWEVGVEQGLLEGMVQTGVTYFENRIENAITTDAFFTTSINNPTFDTYGIESFLQVDPFPNVSARLHYTYTMLERQPGTTPILRRPRHIINGTLGWAITDKLDIGTSLQWVGSYDDVRNGPPFGFTVSRPYTIVNVAAGYALTDAVEITARVNNLLNRQYEPADGFEAPGIEALAGIAVTF